MRAGIEVGCQCDEHGPNRTTGKERVLVKGRSRVLHAQYECTKWGWKNAASEVWFPRKLSYFQKMRAHNYYHVNRSERMPDLYLYTLAEIKEYHVHPMHVNGAIALTKGGN